jgi:hypothetical protein
LSNSEALVELGGGQSVGGGHHVGDDDLAPPLVWDADDERLLDEGMLVEYLLDLHRVHVLAAGDDHVVLAPDDGDVPE